MRAVAALAVAIHHWLQLADHPLGVWLDTWFSLGHWGVIVFFVISGYIIPVSAERPAFLMRRVRRIWPLYLATFGLVVMLQPFPHSVPPADALDLLLNLLLVHYLFGVESIVPGAWTLSIELVFYAIAAALPLTRRPLLAGLGLLLLPMLLPGTVPLYLSVMGVGLILWARQEQKISTPAALALVLIGMLLPLLAPDVRAIAPRVLGVGLAAVALWRPWPPPRALVWLGERSYSLYLLHRVPCALGLAWWLWLPAAVALAWAGERYIERPTRATRSPASNQSPPRFRR